MRAPARPRDRSPITLDEIVAALPFALVGGAVLLGRVGLAVFGKPPQ